jgi:SAM-dependent methyltransferase
MSQTPVPICDYEGSPWRTAFWPGREYEDRAERLALAHLLPPRGKRLIEIGAGFGRLADLYRGYERVVLLDYARSMLEEARARLGGDPRFVFAAADLYNLPLAESAADTAVTVRVLHHVADIPRAFAEIARIVRPRGAYITDFANKRHLKAIIRHWLRTIHWPAVPQIARPETRPPPRPRTPPSGSAARRFRGPDLRRLQRNRQDGPGGTAHRDGDLQDSPFSLEPYEFVKLNFDYHPVYIRANLSRVGFQVRDERAVSTFRVGVLKRILSPAFLASLDGLIQRPTSRLELSPSLFLRAESEKPGAAALNPALWRCLNCNSAQIEERPEQLLCRNCGMSYPRVEGIYDLRAVGSPQ